MGQLFLEPRLRNAVLGEDPELLTWLDLDLASNFGNWTLAGKNLARLGIAQHDAAKTHNEATA